MRADVLFAVLASDFGVELVVGEGPFREPPTVMQATIKRQAFLFNNELLFFIRGPNLDRGEHL